MEQTKVEEEHSSINTTRGNMVHFPRTPQQMSLPAVAGEAETMATPQQASSSYPRPEPPITVPLVLNTTTTHTYSRPLNPWPPRPLVVTKRPNHQNNPLYPPPWHEHLFPATFLTAQNMRILDLILHLHHHNQDPIQYQISHFPNQYFCPMLEIPWNQKCQYILTLTNRFQLNSMTRTNTCKNKGRKININMGSRYINLLEFICQYLKGPGLGYKSVNITFRCTKLRIGTR